MNFQRVFGTILDIIPVHGPSETLHEKTLARAVVAPLFVGRLKMTVPGAPDAFTSRLLDVRVNDGFTDETVVGDTVVLVHHRLAALPSGGTKITYRAEVSGPDADELGPQISADFPQVLAALKVVAETDF